MVERNSGARLYNYVRRYTTLSSALHLLQTRQLTLLSPNKWDDANDVAFMEFFREAQGIPSVMAACFAMSKETYHHWKVFTDGMEGICIEFDRKALTNSLHATPGILLGPVNYLQVRELQAFEEKQIDKLPFAKRDGYKDEREWRVIARCEEPGRQTYEVDIDLSAINRIVLNPWLPPVLADNLRGVIRSINGCERLKIEASRLTNSDQWKAAGRKLAKL